jgi:hypothetical protein
VQAHTKKVFAKSQTSGLPVMSPYRLPSTLASPNFGRRELNLGFMQKSRVRAGKNREDAFKEFLTRQTAIFLFLSGTANKRLHLLRVDCVIRHHLFATSRNKRRLPFANRGL